jgi:hypothetical protein
MKFRALVFIPLAFVLFMGLTALVLAQGDDPVDVLPAETVIQGGNR